MKVAFVCNHSFGFRTLYRGLFGFLEAQGIHCEAVVGEGSLLSEPVEDYVQIPTFIVPMQREPSFFRDIVSLLRLIFFFMRNRYDVVHVSTPKAALLGALAARITFQPKIMFVVRIRIYEDRVGFQRWLLEKVDWLVCHLSNVVVPISKEMADEMIRDGLCPESKIRIFGGGSSNGVNVQRFSRSERTTAIGKQFRERLGIPSEALVMLSMGRLAKGKGLHLLPEILSDTRGIEPPVYMIVAGPLDNREPTDPDILDALDRSSRVVRLGYQADPVPAYAASDIFLFTSHREGFGNVALEAQAMGLPVVGFDIPGVREAVRHDHSGYLAQAFNRDQYLAYVRRLLCDADDRARLSRLAVSRVREEFSNERIWSDLLSELVRLAGEPRAYTQSSRS